MGPQVQACGAATCSAENPGRRWLIGLQEAHQGVQVGRQQILPADMQDDALTDLAALAVVFHQAQVLVAAVGGFDGAQEQERLLLHYKYRA